MKKLFSVFVLMLGLTGAAFAQTQQWSASTSGEGVNIDFSAVTVDDYIESYTITTTGSIDEGWTAYEEHITSGPSGSSYGSGRITGPNEISRFTGGGDMRDPIDALTYSVSLKGPDYSIDLLVELYLDYATGEFILHTR